MSFRIYLAGPDVFLPGSGSSLFEKKKALCAEFGFVGIAPTDGDAINPASVALEQGYAIYRGNIRHMRDAQAIVANMTPFRGVSMDAGTAYEMGYMAALGKPVLGYTHVTLNFATRCQQYYERGCHMAFEPYSAETAIERFDMSDNLMMAGAIADAGFRVHAVKVPPGEELTSLAGFHMCLVDLARRLSY